jgi:phospholipid/cholesterol/gamma-HCH transport system substrate-binding protein
MARARSWKEVRLGAAVLVATAVAAASVLAFARVGALRGDTVRLYAVTPHARGILPGSEVWLAGRKVGVVQDVGFRPPDSDTALRVLLSLDVLAGPSRAIRRDSPVAIRAGGSLIGAPVVAIAPNTNTAPAVRDGDTLVADPGNELESIRTRLTTTVGTEVPIILDNLRVLGAQLATARGTLGALGVEGPSRIGATAGAASAVVQRVTQGAGALGVAFGRGEAAGRLRSARARIGELRALAASPDGTVGRLRSDSALAGALGRLRVDLDGVSALLAEPRGTAGRLAQDRVLQLELARARAELELLLADVRRNPLRYVNP